MIFFFLKNCNLLTLIYLSLHTREAFSPQKKISSTSKHEISLLFSIFLGHFCPPESTDLIGSGSETLVHYAGTVPIMWYFKYLKNICWQVVDGGTGQYSELDINFRVMHPRGHPLVAEFKKSDGVFSQQIKVRIVHPVPEFKDCAWTSANN